MRNIIKISKEYVYKITNLKLFALQLNWEANLTSNIQQNENVNILMTVHIAQNAQTKKYLIVTHLENFRNVLKNIEAKIKLKSSNPFQEETIRGSV